MQPIIIIAGPTAVGKTDLAIWLATKLKTEIISADSMQVYKYMDIGTAKPDLEQQRLAKHHLVDIVYPNQNFSVANYQELFDKTVLQFNETGKIPLVVGGTGLYIRASTQVFSLDESSEPDYLMREQLQAEAETYGNLHLHQKLAAVDPQAAARIHPNDRIRVIRALEVYQTTGIPISRLQTKQPPKYRMIYIFIDRERDELYHRINERVDIMIKQGLIDEVQLLWQKGYGPELKPMQGLGYKQIGDYLLGQCSLDEAAAIMKQKTRNYAKRQITWFKREPLDYCINLTGKKEGFYGDILKYIEGRLGEDVE